MKLISFDKQFKGIVAGVDEAGRGPLAGPLIVAAVILKDYTTLPLTINDSKKLSKKLRENIFEYICENSWYSISIIEPAIIDQINILEATKLGMYKATVSLNHSIDHILIDGNQLPLISHTNAQYHPIIKGDSQSASIAAASIIAKVTRDQIMTKLSKIYPNYGWDKNVGYGTKKHLDAIKEYGITTHHRQSFSPIKTRLTHA